MTEMNQAYLARLQAAILAAIAEASIVECDGQRTAMVMNAEAISALTTTIAGLVASSDACASPARRRRFCDDHARRLQARIAAFQAHAAEHGPPFATVTINPS